MSTTSPAGPAWRRNRPWRTSCVERCGRSRRWDPFSQVVPERRNAALTESVWPLGYNDRSSTCPATAGSAMLTSPSRCCSQLPQVSLCVSGRPASAIEVTVRERLPEWLPWIPECGPSPQGPGCTRRRQSRVSTVGVRSRCRCAGQPGPTSPVPVGSPTVTASSAACSRPSRVIVVPVSSRPASATARSSSNLTAVLSMLCETGILKVPPLRRTGWRRNRHSDRFGGTFASTATAHIGGFRLSWATKRTPPCAGTVAGRVTSSCSAIPTPLVSVAVAAVTVPIAA